MKKLLFGLILSFALFGMATPALAVDGCRQVKVERPGFAYTKVVCVNPTQPVNITTVATSTDGKAVAKSVVIIRSNGGNVSVNSTVVAIASSN